MKKYTLKQIKKLPVYKHNLKAIRALHPDHTEDFARELQTAFNSKSTGSTYAEYQDLSFIFTWRLSPQGGDAWYTLYWQIYRYNELTGAAK